MTDFTSGRRYRVQVEAGMEDRSVAAFEGNYVGATPLVPEELQFDCWPEYGLQFINAEDIVGAEDIGPASR